MRTFRRLPISSASPSTKRLTTCRFGSCTGITVTRDHLFQGPMTPRSFSRLVRVSSVFFARIAGLTPVGFRASSRTCCGKTRNATARRRTGCISRSTAVRQIEALHPMPGGICSSSFVRSEVARGSCCPSRAITRERHDHRMREDENLRGFVSCSRNTCANVMTSSKAFARRHKKPCAVFTEQGFQIQAGPLDLSVYPTTVLNTAFGGARCLWRHGYSPFRVHRHAHSTRRIIKNGARHYKQKPS